MTGFFIYDKIYFMNYNPEKDGIDHINIYSQGRTKLGKWLSNFTYSPISIPEHGQFSSVEGYWYWLRTKDDRFRLLYGYQAKKLGKTLVLSEACNGNFMLYIKKAIDTKIKSNKVMMKELADSVLPFTHYYVFGEHVVNAGFEWIVEHINTRRNDLKNYYNSRPK